MPGWDLAVNRKLQESHFCRGIFTGKHFPGPWVCVEFGDSGSCPGWLIEKPKPPKLKEKCGKGSPLHLWLLQRKWAQKWVTPSVHNGNSSSSWIQIFHIHEGFWGCYMEKGNFIRPGAAGSSLGGKGRWIQPLLHWWWEAAPRIPCILSCGITGTIPRHSNKSSRCPKILFHIFFWGK